MYQNISFPGSILEKTQSLKKQKQNKTPNKQALITSVRWHVLINNSLLIYQSNEYEQRLGISVFSFLSHIDHKAPMCSAVIRRKLWSYIHDTS